MVLLVMLLYFFSHNLFQVCSVEIFGQYVSCLKFINESSESLYVKINSSSSIYKIENCLIACLGFGSYRFGGVQISKGCMCISSIVNRDEGECNLPCPGNETQICGGKDSLSVYATGHFVPGPPKSLEILKVSDTSVDVRWHSPEATNGIINQYSVSACYLETHALMALEPRLQWSYPNDTYKAQLLNLHPGTYYNISVVAHSDLGDGAPKFVAVWTHIGEPNEPDEPEIIARNKNTMVIKLKPYKNENGPVSGFRIIVISEENVFVEPRNLKTWSEAQDEEIPYYIAAEISYENLTKNFLLGDGGTYGSFFNPPLISSKNYHVVVGVRSTFQGITTFSYSRGTKSNVGVIVFTKMNEDHIDITSALVIAIIFSSIILCGLFVAYFIIRRQLSYRRRRAPYRQELTLQGPVIEVVNDGYIPEEVEERVNYYDKLQQQVWNIPRSVLEIKGDVLGQGQFGAVFKGIVQQRGLPMSSVIYVIEDGKLSSNEKRAMLQSLGVMITCGNQINVLALLGTCEVPETLFLVFEHHPIVLKEMLLESRSSDHAVNIYSKFSSLSESSILQTAVGIARGMDYLSSGKVVHKQLSARNIAMADGVIPKITGFGLTSFHKQNQIPDYTRWTAQEVFKRCSYTTKSDVWSFGCLLWEMCALGGTPYSDVSSNDVSARIIHGLRLPQIRYIGDGLYHLMLQCWQIDLDERPLFSQITAVLEDIGKNEVSSELDFLMYPGYQSVPYIVNFEFQQ